MEYNISSIAFEKALSVESCTELIMAIKLNKVVLKCEKSRCYPVQSAIKCLPHES